MIIIIKETNSLGKSSKFNSSGPVINYFKTNFRYPGISFKNTLISISIHATYTLTNFYQQLSGAILYGVTIFGKYKRT